MTVNSVKNGKKRVTGFFFPANFWSPQKGFENTTTSSFAKKSRFFIAKEEV